MQAGTRMCYLQHRSCAGRDPDVTCTAQELCRPGPGRVIYSTALVQTRTRTCPTKQATKQPSKQANKKTTNQPTNQPTKQTNKQTSKQPTKQTGPTNQPTKQPSRVQPSEISALSLQLFLERLTRLSPSSTKKSSVNSRDEEGEQSYTGNPNCQTLNLHPQTASLKITPRYQPKIHIKGDFPLRRHNFYVFTFS